MLLPAIAIASALAASSHGTTSIPAIPAAPAVTAQVDASIGGIAQFIPASVTSASAVIAVFGPALFRRTRPLRKERRVNLQPLPQNYMYFPAAA